MLFPTILIAWKEVRNVDMRSKTRKESCQPPTGFVGQGISQAALRDGKTQKQTNEMCTHLLVYKLFVSQYNMSLLFGKESSPSFRFRFFFVGSHGRCREEIVWNSFLSGSLSPTLLIPFSSWPPEKPISSSSYLAFNSSIGCFQHSSAMIILVVQ